MFHWGLHAWGIYAIVGTVFGVAASLGAGGVLQIQAGLVHLGWIEPSNLFIILVVGIRR